MKSKRVLPMPSFVDPSAGKSPVESSTEKIKDRLVGRVFRYLGTKDRTIHEIEEVSTKYLLRYDSLSPTDRDELVSFVVKHVQALGYLDDLTYTKAYIEEQKNARMPRGPNYIRQFLFRKGVPDQIIKSNLADYYSSEEEETAIKGIVNSRKGANIREGADRRKLVSFLLRRGFNPSLVKKILSC